MPAVSTAGPRPFWPVLLLLAGLAVGLLSLQVTLAASVTAGYRDFSFGTSPTIPTADKPQSKLWWNDGRWWGSLFNPTAGAYTIHWLDLSAQSWVNTGAVVDTRPDAHMDALWDGQKLYVVSGSATDSGKLSRFSYDSTATRYSLDAGFPVTVRPGGAETITIARDSTGQLWVTYTQNSQVRVNRSTGGDTVWGQPFAPAVTGVSVNADDISAVIAFQGNKIGVMWSNQNAKKMYFAVHLDSDADDVWQASQTALPGPSQNATDRWADDHINLKQLSTDGSGRVFAAVKTSLGDMSSVSSSAPQVMLLVRDLAGNWTNSVFGRIQDDHTRPIVLIDEEHAQLYLFATAPTGGGVIYYKTTPLSNIQFPTGLGTPFIKSSTDLKINNATSTKQNLNSTTGLLVLASDDTSNYYLHNFLSLGGAPAPTATPTPTPALTPAPTPTPGPTGTGTIALRSTATAQTTAASPTSLAVNVPTGVQNGDVLVAQVAVRGGSANAIAVPPGWTLLRDDATASAIHVALYYRVAGGEPASYTWSWSSANAGAIGIFAYTGVNTTSPIDAHSGRVNGGTTAVTAPSVTTTAASDQLLFFGANSGQPTFTPPPGLTERWDTRTSGASANIGIEGADKPLGAAGATGDQTATSTVASTNVGQLVALRR